MVPDRIGIVGAGRLGTALAVALSAAGAPVLVGSRREVGTVERVIETCGLVFLTVPDREIAGVAAAQPWRAGQAVVHCSGALGLDVLEAATARGAVPGGLHPLQTFPAGASSTSAVTLFQGIVCGVEAPEPLGGRLEALVERLGARSVRLEGVDRARYHAAAVLVSNHVVALMAAATRAWMSAGLPVETSRDACAPLLLAAAQNVQTLPLERALTGPVARGDTETVARHLEALAGEPDLAALYRALTRELLALDLGHPPEVAASLRALVEG